VPESLEQLTDAVASARESYHKLVLLIGPSGSGKTGLLRALAASKGYAYLNINLALSERMLELTRIQRARQVDRLMKEIVDEATADVILLDNLEILFAPALQVDPLRLLQSTSRNRVIVAAWNGTYRDGVLSYAEPQHPEHRSYREISAATVLLNEDAKPHS
jgi:DNA polymerase III delta prime subunit